MQYQEYIQVPIWAFDYLINKHLDQFFFVGYIIKKLY